MFEDSMCPWTKGCCHSLHVVVKLFPTQFPSLFSHCFINVLGDCFPPSMWGLMAGLLVFVRQGSGLPLGAGFQQWKLLDVLALNFHFGRQFFNGFSVLFVDQSEKPIVYSQVFQNNEHSGAS